MKIIIAIVCVIGVLSLLSCSSIRPSSFLNLTLSSSHYEINSDVSFGSDSRQKLDIYYPNQSVSKVRGKDKPVIVFVFGGAWKTGDKKDFKFIGHAFTQAGYRVVIPNYRLYPTVRYPDFVDDVADAIQYIEQHSNELIDLSQGMVLMGHSAGAHTAALLATNQTFFKNRNIRTPLKGLVALAGPYDLNLDDPEVTPIFRGYTNNDSSVKPARLVHSTMPPVLLLHGANDTRVGPYHMERFTLALQQSGIPHETKLYPKVAHVKIIASMAAPLRYLNPSYKDTLEFLSKLN